MTSSETPLTRPRSLGRLLNFATGASNALCQNLLGRHGITLAQWVVLSGLWQKDGLTVRELAEYTGNDLPATSRILDRMEEKGLLDRVAHPDDRRAVLVRLSGTGEALRGLETFYETVNTHLLKDFDRTEAEQLFTLLARVEANARSGSEEPDS